VAIPFLKKHRKKKLATIETSDFQKNHYISLKKADDM